MKTNLNRALVEYNNTLEVWAKNHLSGLFLFNIILIVLVLLNTAQYFKPYFYIGVNPIFLTALVLSILLLDFRSKIIFIISIFFFILSFILKLVRIDVWADRASIYFFQSFFVGLVLLMFKKD